MKMVKTQPIVMNKPINVLCETYRIREQIDEATGEVKSVFLEGVAITFNKPTRNRVAYTYESGIAAHKTLIGKPFLDTHNDSSIRTHPPFGHVIMCEPGTNPKNGLPCLNYRVDIDPDEKIFIRKAKRGDIPGVSIQVLVDEVDEKQDAYGTYIEANIREYLELSGVLIPGDGDTTMAFAESFKKMKENLYKEYSKNPNISSDDEEEEKPLQDLPDDIDVVEGTPEDNIDKIDIDKPVRFIGARKTEVAFKGCNCPACGMQMLKDSYKNGFQLRCWACDYRISSKQGGK